MLGLAKRVLAEVEGGLGPTLWSMRRKCLSQKCEKWCKEKPVYSSTNRKQPIGKSPGPHMLPPQTTRQEQNSRQLGLFHLFTSGLISLSPKAKLSIQCAFLFFPLTFCQRPKYQTACDVPSFWVVFFFCFQPRGWNDSKEPTGALKNDEVKTGYQSLQQTHFWDSCILKSGKKSIKFKWRREWQGGGWLA